MANQYEHLSEYEKLLEYSQDPAELEQAAVGLAALKNPEALALLTSFMRRPEFLDRLDDQADLTNSFRHLSNVMSAVQNHAFQETERLCLTLGEDEQFLSQPDRKIFLLPALASVRPMSEQAVMFFRQANAEGYFATTGPLLVKNGSPRAFELFESMIRDRGVEADVRVDVLHNAVLPYRTELRVLESCARLLDADLENSVVVGVVETVFDFKSREWFGPAMNAPFPPPWEAASNESLELVIRLADQVRGWDSLSPPLRDAVNETAETARAILAQRGSP
jgi:hypothetical protein